MALIVLWLVIYLFAQAFSDAKAKTDVISQEVIDAYNAGPSLEDEPIAVEWELLPAVNETTERN